MLAATLEYSTPRETDRATVTSTLLTQIDDALTAAAIVIGGAFVLNSFTVARRWLRSSGRWSETRKLIVPDQEAA